MVNNTWRRPQAHIVAARPLWSHPFLEANARSSGMITAIVTAPVPAGWTRTQWLEHSRRIAPRFQSIPGLIRKQFLFDPERGLGGGVYLWENRAAADACYAGIWRENFKNAFGADPRIEFFDSAVVVDNVAHEIEVAA
jgi:hypothetical protein